MRYLKSRAEYGRTFPYSIFESKIVYSRRFRFPLRRMVLRQENTSPRFGLTTHLAVRENFEVFTTRHDRSDRLQSRLDFPGKPLKCKIAAMAEKNRISSCACRQSTWHTCLRCASRLDQTFCVQYSFISVPSHSDCVWVFGGGLVCNISCIVRHGFICKFSNYLSSSCLSLHPSAALVKKAKASWEGQGPIFRSHKVPPTFAFFHLAVHVFDFHRLPMGFSRCRISLLSYLSEQTIFPLQNAPEHEILPGMQP